MSEHQKFPEFFVTSPTPCPYLPGQEERKLFTHLTHDKPKAVVNEMLTNGFRRSQNIAYMPYCDVCQACLPVRVVARECKPGKTMRRVAMRNHDLTARRRAALPTTEQHALFRRYIEARHAAGGMADMTVLDFAMMIEDSIIDTTIVEYRLPPKPEYPRGKLVGVALQDKLSDGLSMVYSFFDPDYPERSFGTYMILDAINAATALGLPFVYLGYWIEKSEKMSYKARFHPQEVLDSTTGWTRRAT